MFILISCGKKGGEVLSIETLASWWVDAGYRVVLTGAGMSTESGLPDFRSPQGLWKEKDPRKLASISALFANPGEFYEFYRMRLAGLNKAEPHKGHLVLAQLQKERLLNAIITQNVDGLHQKAGAARVIELHGSLREAVCLNCGEKYRSKVLEEKDFPTCAACGGKLKPGVVLFGETLPSEALRQADMETRRAKLFVVIGSSLEVSPANYFPLLARDVGARLAFINLEPTDMDDQAHLVIRGKAGEVLEELYALIKSLSQ
jgi:NAD-dependent deacetylase